MLKYGYAKAKFTENATYRQTLVLQAAQVVKVVALKAQPDLADAATKEAANVAENAEVVTEEVATVTAEVVQAAVIAEADQVLVARTVAVVIARVVRVVRVAQVAVIVQAVQAEEDKYKVVSPEF